MPKSTNEWIEKRYELLLTEFKDKEFSGDDAKRVLTEQGKSEESSVPIILSELKKRGLIEAKLDSQDSRKRIYQLKLPNEVISEILTRSDIESILKKHDKVGSLLEDFKIQKAAKEIILQSEGGNRFLNEKEPWNLFKTDKEKTMSITYALLRLIRVIAVELYPFTPYSSELLWKNMNEKESVLKVGWEGAKEDFTYPLEIKRFPPLFTKLSTEEVISKLEELKGGGKSK